MFAALRRSYRFPRTSNVTRSSVQKRILQAPLQNSSFSRLLQVRCASMVKSPRTELSQDMSLSDIGFGEESARQERMRERDVFGGLSVKEMFLVGPSSHVCHLQENDELGDFAEALAASGQTAMAVMDKADHVVGLLTENDIMRAYFEGTPPDQRLRDWLQSGFARAPSQMLPRLTVQPSSPLSDVAELIISNAISGECACHHVVVTDGGVVQGVLSSLDMVKALCRPEMWEHRHLVDPELSSRDMMTAVGHRSVLDVMKPLEHIFTCKPGETMKDVLRVLLLSQQTSVLIVDEDGIYGIMTPRDVVNAFSNAIDKDVKIIDWLSQRPGGVGDRTIASDASVVDAAAMMTTRHLNHLVVVQPGSVQRALGVVSSLDLILRTRSVLPELLDSSPLVSGPSVGECLVSSVFCEPGTTLGSVAQTLVEGNRTSALVLSSDGRSTFGILSESEVVRAYLDGWPTDSVVDGFMTEYTNVPVQMIVRSSLPLTEAASLMLCATDPGRPCHHLIIVDERGTWIGIFSALDVARTLLRLRSDLDVANIGADTTTVAKVMKPYASVPRCSKTDTIREALCHMLNYGHNAAFVEGERGSRAIITTRCALIALAEGISPETSVDAWLSRRDNDASYAGDDDAPASSSREVSPDTCLVRAAALMTGRSMHHLVVVEKPGTTPVGVLSSLDLARGVASINCHCPFVSLAWLQRVLGPRTCEVQEL